MLDTKSNVHHKRIIAPLAFLVIFSMIFGMITVRQGSCASLYSVTGVVTDLSNDQVVIFQGAEKFEFNRADLKNQNFDNTLGNLRKGDKITVLYSLQAKKIMTPQEAGEARPGENAPFDHHIILDDRTFLNAKSAQQ